MKIVIWNVKEGENIRNKIVCITIVILVSLLTLIPGINAIEYKNSFRKYNHEKSLSINLTSIVFYKYKKVNKDEYSSYFIIYKIINEDTENFSGTVTLVLKRFDTEWVFDVWREKISLSPNESVNCFHIVEIPTSINMSFDEERFFANHRVQLRIEPSLSIRDEDDDFVEKYWNTTNEYMPTIPQLLVTTPWRYIEKLSNSISYIELPSKGEMPNVLENRLGWINNFEKHLLNISVDLKSLLDTDAEFVSIISKHTIAVFSWLKTVCTWFDLWVHNINKIPDKKQLFLLISGFQELYEYNISVISNLSIDFYGYVHPVVEQLVFDSNEFINWSSEQPWNKPIKVEGTIEGLQDNETINITCHGILITTNDLADGILDNKAFFEFTIPIEDNEIETDQNLLYDCSVYVEGDKHEKKLQTKQLFSYCYAEGVVNVYFDKESWKSTRCKTHEDIFQQQGRFFKKIFEKIFKLPKLMSSITLLKNIFQFIFKKTVTLKETKKVNEEQNPSISLLEQRMEIAKKIRESFDFKGFKKFVNKNAEPLKKMKGMVYKKYYPGDPTNEPNTVYYAAEDVVVGFNENVNVEEVKSVEGYPVVDRIPEIHAVLVKVTGIDPKDFIEIVKQKENVDYAELNLLRFCSSDPNDPYWKDGKQWAHSKLQIDKAWDLPLKTEYAFIAIIDTGVDYKHEDLWGSKASPNYLIQYDVVNNDPIADDEIPDGTKSNGHGTKITGIISAMINNNKGIAGVVPDGEGYSHNPRVTPNIAHFKVFNKYGKAYSFYVAKAIRTAAVTYMPSVICMSFGSYVGSGEYANVERYATWLARYNYSCLLFAATGNGGNDDGIQYPAAYKSVIAVGAVDQNEKLCRYPGNWGSNYNKNSNEVDLVAPGIDIITTFENGGYGFMNGTSASTAFVTGIAALWYGGRAANRVNPVIKNEPDLCEKALFSHCKDLGDKGVDPMYGHGIPDAYEIVKSTMKSKYKFV